MEKRKEKVRAFARGELFESPYDDWVGSVVLTGWVNEAGMPFFTEGEPRFDPFTGKELEFVQG